MSHLWPDANCNGQTELFFSIEYPDIHKALMLCHTCPRLKQCEELSVGEYNGVWAGEYRCYRKETNNVWLNYKKWLKKSKRQEAIMAQKAEELGVDIEQLRAIVGL